jgi:hypothetical protein
LVLLPKIPCEHFDGQVINSWWTNIDSRINNNTSNVNLINDTCWTCSWKNM